MNLSNAMLAAAAAVLLLVRATDAQAPTMYRAEYLGPAIGAAAMNESGAVVGSTSLGGAIRGWIAGPGAPVTALPLPAGHLSSFAHDINDAGVIVGVVSTSTSPEFFGEAAAWTPDGAGGYVISLLGKLPGHQTSAAVALNDVGDIVGHSTLNGFRSPVLFTAPGGVLDLGPTGVFDPHSINDARVLVDSSFVVKTLDLDTMVAQSLGLPTGPPSYIATDSAKINASGQVAGLGILATSTSCDRVAARYTEGVGWQVFSGCGTANGAYDLNDRGDVVMRLNVAPYVRFEGQGTYRIEDLILEDSGHWYVINGYGLTINDTRQMVVAANHATSGQSGLLFLHPTEGVCQTDLGFGGPGGLSLSVCGGDLATGTQATLQLVGALPGQPAWLVAGLSASPTPFKGGTLVPLPVLVVLPVLVGAGGSATLPGVPGGGGPLAAYVQFVQQDPAQPAGYALSNAVRVEWLP